MKKRFVLAFILGLAAGAYTAFAAKRFLEDWRKADERWSDEEDREFRKRMVDLGRG